MARPRMVAVAMGDDGAVNSVSGIDMKPAGLAVESAARRFQPLIWMNSHSN
jgi:hypothetical protein